MSSPVGSFLGHYQIVGHLGSGAMSEVYLGVDPELRVEVAVKLISDALLKNPEMVERFKREAQAAAQLNHPNVARVFYFNFKGERPFYAMELIRGVSLATAIERRLRFTWAQYLALFSQATQGLQAAAAQGIIHRDVKPGNLMVGNDGLLRIVDFGLAKLTEDKTLTQSGMMMGTPYYLSPEGVRGEAVDHRADIYSLGVTFHHLLVGSPPYDGETAYSVMLQHVQSPVPDALRSNPRLPASLVQLLQRMMAKEARRREGDYDQILATLETIRQELNASLQEELAYCEQDHSNAVVKEGRCSLCRQPFSVRARAEFADLFLVAWRAPSAREAVVDYVARALGREAMRVDSMLDHLPFKLGHRMPFEKAKRMQRTFYDLGADAEVKPLEEASSSPADEKLNFPLGGARGLPVPRGVEGRGVRAGKVASPGLSMASRLRRSQPVLIGVLLMLVIILSLLLARLALSPEKGIPGSASLRGGSVPSPVVAEPPPLPPKREWIHQEIRGLPTPEAMAFGEGGLAAAAARLEGEMGWAFPEAIPIVLDGGLPLRTPSDPWAWQTAEPGVLPLGGVTSADQIRVKAAAGHVLTRALLLGMSENPLPPWLVMGISLWMETGVGGVPAVSPPLAADDALIPLRFWSGPPRNRDPQGAARAEAWCTFLLAQPDGGRRMRQWVELLGSGADLETATRGVYGKTTASLQQEWILSLPPPPPSNPPPPTPAEGSGSSAPLPSGSKPEGS